MTNREWLESLDNHSLTLFLCDSLPINENRGIYRMHYLTGIDQLKRLYTCSEEGIEKWLEEEYRE